MIKDFLLCRRIVEILAALVNEHAVFLMSKIKVQIDPNYD